MSVAPDLPPRVSRTPEGVRPHPLLAGAVDTHVHPGPAFIRRRLSVVDAARDARGAGMAAIVVKDHHMPTVALAELAAQQVGFPVHGSLVLNASVGGCNAEAVEASVRMGARVVWLPTISARNHQAGITAGASFPPSGRGREAQGLVELVVGGRPVPALCGVLELLGQHPGVVLATGHASAAEVDVILPAALAAGIEKVIVTHPDYLVGADHDQLRAWTRRGAYAELAGSTSWSGSALYSVPVARSLAMIRGLGSEHVVMSSDFGQVDNPPPVAAMSAWIAELLDSGLGENDLVRMLRTNPAALLDA